MTEKIRLATIWLDGCSGCHMSFLDIDQRMLELAEKVEIVYSPLVDAKEFPENVDITLVEGALGTDEDIQKIKKIRENTRLLVAFGDCAVTANIPSMRNPFGADATLKKVYLEHESLNQQIPSEGVPALLPQALPLHQMVKVDLFVPGCPPSADTIFYTLSELIEGRVPDLTTLSRFGA
ncbi:NADP oxidoreductase [Leptolinea tardivitalis]|uniref:NADP oxidoreductase n=1 Tax=Leptolinea tardivitalis TaxID=229920 RepID=A0A0P6WSJ3_9CHLR|nr:NADP oxidoreductase [Leptolinea tardivitalis]KPL73169.1 NADP oxidoreductase [Leptolinea tardivitalis]GAP21267.1 NAD(P)-dependent nickel-iron dehydrogenase subunit HoxY [Leptolinea tardivitalis]